MHSFRDSISGADHGETWSRQARAALDDAYEAAAQLGITVRVVSGDQATNDDPAGPAAVCVHDGRATRTSWAAADQTSAAVKTRFGMIATAPLLAALIARFSQKLGKRVDFINSLISNNPMVGFQAIVGDDG
jgi:subtilase family serine protease